MTDTTQERWVLEHQGRRLEVEGPPSRTTRYVRLFVDGEQAAEEKVTGKKTARIGHDGLTVRVDWDKAGHLSVVSLLPAAGGGAIGPDAGHLKELKDVKDLQSVKDLVTGAGETWFTPPPGSRAERRERPARRHPRLFAARHVAAAVAKVLVPLLGIGALVRIPKPDLDLPDLDPPSLPRPDVPWPDIDLSWLPDITLPGWVQAILQTAKYWGPVLGASLVALQEYQRRKKQREKAARQAAAGELEHEQEREPRSAAEKGE